MKKKLLSMILAALMLLTLVPTVALATEPSNWSLLAKAMAGEAQKTVDGVFEVTENDPEAGTRTVKLFADITADADAGDSALIVPANKTVVLDLNGHVLDRGLISPESPDFTPNDNGSVIEVNADGVLTIIDGNTASQNAGYIDVYGVWHKGVDGHPTASETEMTINGGIITGGTGMKCTELDSEYRGGGIRVQGKLILAAGTIAGNRAGIGGGGVSVATTGKFYLVGGMIAYNISRGYGGGVCVDTKGTFNMQGGKITENVVDGTNPTYRTRAGNGGGVFTDDKFTMTGGEISGNKANGLGGGVYVANDEGDQKTSKFQAGGTARIIGNYGKDDAVQNLYLPAGKKLAFCDEKNIPQEGMSIGVTAQEAHFTKNGTSTDAPYLFADKDGAYVKFVTDHFEMTTVPAESYKITVAPSACGVVYTDKQIASETDMVQLTVVPDEGYQLKSLTVKTTVGDEEIKTKNNTFEMPNMAVTVMAVFEEESRSSVLSHLTHLLAVAISTTIAVRAITGAAKLVVGVPMALAFAPQVLRVLSRFVFFPRFF